MANPTILVTGGAGYVGGHAALHLRDLGYNVVVLDTLERGHRNSVTEVIDAPLIEGSTLDRPLLDRVFSEHSIDAVMHFAAYAYVGESVDHPRMYYRNNVSGSLTLLEAMVEAGVNHIVFSSTCATFGIPEVMPITEATQQRPINPYGASKLMVERILADFDAAYGVRHVALRYFNAAGADPEGRLGENHEPETHIIPCILETAAGRRDAVGIFGTDYPTPDGTCIRDYVHVMDLADAHVRALKRLLDGGASDAFNLGTGVGNSVREVVKTCEDVSGRPVRVNELPRRPGDPPVLVACNDKARQVLGWEPRYAKLATTIEHAWRWMSSLPKQQTDTAATRI